MTDYFSGDYFDGDYFDIPDEAPASQTVTTTGIGSGEAFGSAQVNLHMVVSGIVSGEAFGTAKLNLHITLASIGSGEAFGSAQLNLHITPTGITSEEEFGSSTILGEAAGQTITLTGISSGEGFGTPELNLNITGPSITSGESFGTPSLGLNITLSGLHSGEAFGTPQLNFIIKPSGIEGGEGVPVPFLIFDQILTPISITTTETIGTPSIWHYDIYIFPEGISSEEEFGEAGWIGHVYIHIEADLTIQEPVTTIKVLNPDGGLNVKNTSQQHHINQPNTPLVLEAPWTDLKIYTEN